MHNLPFLPTICIENVWGLEQLDFLNKKIKESCLAPGQAYHTWGGPDEGKLTSNKYEWDYNKDFEIKKILELELPTALSENLIVGKTILLESFVPYQIHSDYHWFEDLNGISSDELPFYIIMIPLGNYDSNTIVLNQIGQNEFTDYKNNNNPLPLNEQMSREEYQKYFNHCWIQERQYISIKDILKWNSGSLLAFDIRYFHCSNDFRRNGLNKKEGIIIVTKIKKDNFLTTQKELMKLVDRTNN